LRARAGQKKRKGLRTGPPHPRDAPPPRTAAPPYETARRHRAPSTMSDTVNYTAARPECQSDNMRQYP